MDEIEQLSTLISFHTLIALLNLPSLLYAFTKIVARMISGLVPSFSKCNKTLSSVCLSFSSIHVDNIVVYNRVSGLILKMQLISLQFLMCLIVLIIR